MGKELAVSTFLENKDFYHPIAAKMVASDLEEKKKKKSKFYNVKIQHPLVVGGIIASAAIIIALLRGRKRA